MSTELRLKFQQLHISGDPLRLRAWQIGRSKSSKEMAMPNAGPVAANPNGAKNDDLPLIGMSAAAGAFFLLSIMTLCAKVLSERHNVAEIAFWRNAIAILPFLAVIFLFNRRDILTVNSKPRIMITRSVVGTMNIMFVFGTFALLPLADATAIIFTAALFTPVLGFFLLGEHVGPYRWSAVIVGFIGVLVVAQPGGEWNVAGIALGLTAAFFQAILASMLRLLGKSEQPETMTFYFLLIGFTLLAPAMPFIATLPTRNEILPLIGLGLSGCAMQFLLSVAYKYAPAALVSPFNYTQIVWAILFGWAFFGDWPAPNILIGAAIIIASSFIVILRERYLARKGRLARPAAGD
jgi:drug/metabolite transporter (DMT)-like permease